MKLVLTGASGMVGSEVLSQALKMPEISSIVVLARRHLQLPSNFPPSEVKKVETIIVDDFMNYNEEAKSRLTDADACIWLLAITPHKLFGLKADFIRKVNFDFPMKGLETMASASSSSAEPFRFIYTSGALTERDPRRSLWVMSEQRHMRGETELQMLKLGHEKKINVHIAKFGGVMTASTSYLKLAFAFLLEKTMGLPSIQVRDLATALLEQAKGNGKDQDTIINADLIEIAQKKRSDL